MGGTGSCDSIKIIFGYHINSQHIILNIKFALNRLFHVVDTPAYRFDLYGRPRTRAPMTIIIGSIIWSQYTSLNIKFGVNRMFYVVKTPVYRFDLYERYRTLWTDDDNIRKCQLELVYKYTDLTYMGGTRPCGPMTIIFGSVIYSQYTSLNIKFGVNRTFHVLKTPVYRFDLYGRYRTLQTDDDNFWQCY